MQAGSSPWLTRSVQRNTLYSLGDTVELRNVERAARDAIAAAECSHPAGNHDAVGVLNDGSVAGKLTEQPYEHERE